LLRLHCREILSRTYRLVESDESNVVIECLLLKVWSEESLIHQPKYQQICVKFWFILSMLWSQSQCRIRRSRSLLQEPKPQSKLFYELIFEKSTILAKRQESEQEPHHNFDSILLYVTLCPVHILFVLFLNI
jgi:hypothetical protein